MRTFYAFWFFFSAGWGHLIATSPELAPASGGRVLAMFPVAIACGLVLTVLELSRMPAGKRADMPSLMLKPWNYPTGLLQFIALTFVFSSVWGIVFVIARGLPGAYAALHFLALGGGPLVALLLAPRILPSKFVKPEPSTNTSGSVVD